MKASCPETTPSRNTRDQSSNSSLTRRKKNLPSIKFTNHRKQTNPEAGSWKIHDCNVARQVRKHSKRVRRLSCSLDYCVPANEHGYGWYVYGIAAEPNTKPQGLVRTVCNCVLFSLLSSPFAA
uniref:Uncharacterized protein n=1 Tax=Amphora coffeiformis TaxID=265554 RepID=A0A7S3L434_9STRA